MRSFLTLLTLLLATFSTQTLAALLVIDYGSEWTKASLMKPGTPFDVLLDKDSKRKMMSSVGWKRDERVFGAEAANVANRFPLAHFPYIKPLLASSHLPNSSLYPVQPILSPTGSLLFPHVSPPTIARSSKDEEITTWTPEEILAQQLSYVKSVAEESSHEAITDLYVTVPSYFSQAQRRAYKDAAEIAGLNIVGMISEGAAIGLNYAMTRTFTNKEFHLIYDSGAVKTTATILSFETRPDELPALKGSSNKSKKPRIPNNSTYIDVISFDSEVDLGGVHIDLVLRELMIEDFERGKGKGLDVRNDARAMRRLWKEAGRVKSVLSANQETTVNVESLTNDIDYRSRLTRAQLEEASAGFKARFGNPIERALAKAGMTVEQLDSVILFGGNTRVPMVQASIKELAGQDKIAQNVNSDEAAVLGAAFYGASISHQFKAKVELKLQEVIPYTISYAIDGQEQGVAFPAGSNVTHKETLVLKNKEDCVVDFVYSGTDAPQPTQILSVELHDVAQTLSNLTEQEVADPSVKLTMKIDHRGLLHAVNVVASGEQKSESLTGKFMGLFGGSKEKEDDTTEGSEDAAEAEKKAEAEAEAAKPKEKKVAVRFSEHASGTKPLSSEAKKASKQRLANIRKVERGVLEREEARNVLEGFLYRLQRVLDGADTQALQIHGRPDEIKHLKEGLAHAFTWLAENADTADAASLKKVRADLEAVEMPVVKRYSEARNRPQAIENFQKAMYMSRAWFVEARTNMTTAENGTLFPWTEGDLDLVELTLKDNESWMKEQMEKQEAVLEDPTADPILLTADLQTRGKRIQNIVQSLQRKPMPRPPRSSSTKPKATKTTTTENATATTNVFSETPSASGTTTVSTADPSSSSADQEVPKHEEL